MDTLIIGGKIVNEGLISNASILISGEKIKEIFYNDIPDFYITNSKIIDVKGKFIIPGIIDDHVHFREPGLTSKGDIASESCAAVAGGVTSFMDMPNTVPPAINQDIIEEKFRLASEKSLTNYSFYIGASNENAEELNKTDVKQICGIKVFMGSSTGNMLVDNKSTLEKIFANIKIPVVVHSESESVIRENLSLYRQKYGDNIPFSCHSVIRSEEACYKSSLIATELARKYNTRLHLLHLSTEKEISLLDNNVTIENKKITAEVCVNHLWFNDKSYLTKKGLVKCNPSIKCEKQRQALIDSVKSNHIDLIATDHAPHLLSEKYKPYISCPSGIPSIQHSLVMMLEMYKNNIFTIEEIVRKMCHAPALIFNIKNRGFLRKDYYADIVIVDLNNEWIVDKSNILYKCGWSPLEGEKFSSKVEMTFVNGKLIYEKGIFNKNYKGQKLEFNR